jgi:hypothetical protein
MAVCVLAVGLIGAEVTYLRGTRSGNSLDDPSLLGFDKAAARQVATLYGQQGVIVQGWSNDLAKPGTQAVIIVAATLLVSGVCFYIASLLAAGRTTSGESLGGAGSDQ